MAKLKLDYCGEGVYHLHIADVSEEDNANYMCVAVNNGGREVSKAELYVLEKGEPEIAITCYILENNGSENFFTELQYQYEAFVL